MKEKYSSGTDRQGSTSSKQEPPVQYVGFFGSWDAPKYRFYLTFVRIFMASVFLGLMYVNARMIHDNFLWSFILEDELSLIIVISIEGMVLLTLALLASVSYKFYRHLKKEEAKAKAATDRLNVHVNHMHLNFMKIKTELWSQLISIENKLVNSATISTQYPSDGMPALKFNDDQYVIWKHLTNLERVFGCGYNIAEDTEADGYISNKMLSYRPLVNSFDQLELGIEELLESGTNVHHAATVADMICYRLIKLEENNRQLLQTITNTDNSLNAVLPKINRVADLEVYSSKIRTEIEAKLSIRTLSVNDRIIQKLQNRGIATVGDLTHCSSAELNRWLGCIDAELVETAMARLNPDLQFPWTREEIIDRPMFTDIDLESFDDSVQKDDSMR